MKKPVRSKPLQPTQGDPRSKAPKSANPVRPFHAPGKPCPHDCVAVHNAMSVFLESLMAHTIPASTGRKVSTMYADLALSNAYDEMCRTVVPSFLRFIGADAEPVDRKGSGAVVATSAGRVGGDGVDPVLANAFNSWISAISWSADPHNQAVAPGPGRRYRFGDQIASDALESGLSAKRSIEVHIRKSHIGEVGMHWPAGNGPGDVGGSTWVPRTLACEVLQGLLHLKALDADHRAKAADIAQAAVGDPEPARVKSVLADLCRHGLVDSCLGSGGGSWLTTSGALRARGMVTKR